MIDFTNEEYISQYERDLDKVKVKVLELEAFQSLDGQQVQSLNGKDIDEFLNQKMEIEKIELDLTI